MFSSNRLTRNPVPNFPKQGLVRRHGTPKVEISAPTPHPSRKLMYGVAKIESIDKTEALRIIRNIEINSSTDHIGINRTVFDKRNLLELSDRHQTTLDNETLLAVTVAGLQQVIDDVDEIHKGIIKLGYESSESSRSSVSHEHFLITPELISEPVK